MHFLSVLLVRGQGQLWHWDRKALIGVGRPGWCGYLAAVAAGGVGCVVFFALLCWLPIASVGQVKALLLAVLLLLVLLVAAMVAALKELHVARSLANGAAIRRWKNTHPGYTFYKISYLAMYPQAGEGFTFARTAIKQAVPPGAGIYTEARSARHRVIYARAGLHPIPSGNGVPTLAMGAVTV